MNTECSRIADQLNSVVTEEAWYGDSVRKILHGVTGEQAQAHPIPNAHSIWELVVHVDAWCKFALAAVRGTPIPPWPAMPKELDWPLVHERSEKAWNATVSSFFANHKTLVDAIRACQDEKLGSVVPGRTYNFYRLFHSAIQHAIYHAGQIALLKKMQR
jgi:DinB superfamily